MEHPGFFERAGPFALGAVAAAADAKLADGVDPDLALKDVRPLDEAGEGDLSFVDNPKYLPAFATTGASACLVAPKFANQAPAATACLVTPEPYRAFARALLLFYPDALKPKAARRQAAYRCTRPPDSSQARSSRRGRWSDPRHASGRGRQLRPAASSVTACMSGGTAISARMPR